MHCRDVGRAGGRMVGGGSTAPRLWGSVRLRLLLLLLQLGLSRGTLILWYAFNESSGTTVRVGAWCRRTCSTRRPFTALVAALPQASGIHPVSCHSWAACCRAWVRHPEDRYQWHITAVAPTRINLLPLIFVYMQHQGRYAPVRLHKLRHPPMTGVCV